MVLSEASTKELSFGLAGKPTAISHVLCKMYAASSMSVNTARCIRRQNSAGVAVRLNPCLTMSFQVFPEGVAHIMTLRRTVVNRDSDSARTPR